MPDTPGRPNFHNLKAWKEATHLVTLTYAVCAKQRRRLDLRLSEQIKRAAVSIPSNVAEGNGRGTNKDALRFLYIARGSLHELIAQVEACQTMNAFTPEDALQLLEQTSIVGRLIGSLIRYRKSRLENEDP